MSSRVCAPTSGVRRTCDAMRAGSERSTASQSGKGAVRRGPGFPRHLSAECAAGSSKIEIGAIVGVRGVVQRLDLVARRRGLAWNERRLGVGIAGRVVVDIPLVGRQAVALFGKLGAAHRRPGGGADSLAAIVD